MTRLDSKAGAGALVALAGVYLAVSLATGHSARAEVPPDLSPRSAETALDVWKTAALMVQQPRTAVVDVRPSDAFARYHLPGAVSVPGASAEQVREALRSAPAVVIVSGKDEVAQKLVASVHAADAAAKVYYLVDGARSWYVAFQLPIPLFSDSAPPSGYAESLAAVNGWFQGHPSAAATPDEQQRALAALQTLARAGYQPNLLQGARKPASSGGAKKKLSGGCG